ncbi:hypothetical protein GL297_10035 [Komagataeibacter sp. FXV2]|nr:hypothetical protein [Komagataeibacter sp. FXV2]
MLWLSSQQKQVISMSDTPRHLNISKILGGRPSPDGSKVVLEVEDGDGAKLHLSVPPAQLVNCLPLFAKLASDCQAVGGGKPNPVYDVTQWELGTDRSRQEVFLSLNLPPGGRLTFHLPAPAPQGIYETLGQMLRVQAQIFSSTH